MQRTAPGLRTDPTTRLAELERRRPEWHAWLRLLGEAEHALDDAGWRPPLTDAGVGATSDEAPLLNGRTLKVDAGRVQQLVHRLAATAAVGHLTDAGLLHSFRPSEADAMRLLAAAIRQDLAELGAVADAAGVDRGAMTSVAHLAAFPLLQSYGRLLEDHLPRFWPHGYCPICAAWPILAERRGLDRTRRLRCGRCSAGWEVQWLCCIYCGERGHERLGSLIPEDRGEMLKVETCASCRGYLKSIATLQEIHPFELLLQDLETIELDLVALDRGYYRPEKNGFSLEVEVV